MRGVDEAHHDRDRLDVAEDAEQPVHHGLLAPREDRDALDGPVFAALVELSARRPLPERAAAPQSGVGNGLDIVVGEASGLDDLRGLAFDFPKILRGPVQSAGDDAMPVKALVQVVGHRKSSWRISGEPMIGHR